MGLEVEEAHNMLSQEELRARGFDEGEELLLAYIESDSDEEVVRDKVVASQNALPSDKQVHEILYGDPKHCHAERHLAEMAEFFKSMRSLDQEGFPIPAGRMLRHRHYADLDAASFEEVIDIPCVLDGVAEAEGWPAASSWNSQEAFNAANSNATVPVTELFPLHGLGKPQKLSVPLDAYSKYAESNKVDFPYYPWERDFAGERAKWLDMFWQPKLFRDDIFSLTPCAREWFPLSTHRFVILGGERCGAAVHRDPKASGAWNHCLFGTKRWCFFPPTVSSETLWGSTEAAANYREFPSTYWWLDHYPRLRARDDLGMLEVLQKPGDTLYVPPGWWHAVINLPSTESGEHLTLCVTQNAVTPAMLRGCAYCWPTLLEYPFADELSELLREKMPDVAQHLNIGHGKPVDSKKVEDAPTEDEPSNCSVSDALIERRNFLLNPETDDSGTPWREVSRVAASGLSLKAFRSEYVQRGRPAVITGMSEQLLRHSGCPWKFLEERFASKCVCSYAQTDESRDSNCLGSPDLVTIGDLLNAVGPRASVSEASAPKKYLYDLSLPHKLPELLEWWRIPRYFAHDYLQQTRVAHTYKGSWPTLFVGAAGTSSTTHVDRWHGHFWMVQVAGVKRWTMWAPKDTHLLQPTWEGTRMDPSFPSLCKLADVPEAQAAKVVVELHPGEVLFVPGGTPHAVENLSPTIAFAGNFVDDSNIEDVLADLAVLATYDSVEAQTLGALTEIDFDPDLGMWPEQLPADAFGVEFEEFSTGAAARWAPGVQTPAV